VADAVNYIFTKADSMGKPCVVNISAGSYYGSHDAKDLQAQLINNLITAKPGRALVCAAGNLGNWPIHLQYDSPTGTDTVFTWFSRKANPVSNPLSTVYIEMWSDVANFPNVRYNISAHKDAPGFEYRGQIAFSNVAPHLGMMKTDTLWSVNGNRLARIQTFASLSNGRYSMIYNIIEDSAMVWSLNQTGIGKFDLWTFQFWQFSGTLPTAAQYPDIVRYNAPDTQQNIVSSFTCSDKVITAGEYINKGDYLDCASGATQMLGYNPDSLSPGSSHGPTRTGVVKPDISSPGNFTFAAAVTYYIGTTQPLTKIIQQGCMHVRDGGTSTASPGVAGIAALYFQRYPAHNWQQVKNAITRCARHDNYTGFTGFPNNDWGWGKADGFETVAGCAALGLGPQQSPVPFNLYAQPNPSTGETTVYFDALWAQRLGAPRLQVCDALGRTVSERSLEGLPGRLTLPAGALRKGLYFVSLLAGGERLQTARLVVL
jgi:subtilisin family serine protease